MNEMRHLSSRTAGCCVPLCLRSFLSVARGEVKEAAAHLISRRLRHLQQNSKDVTMDGDGPACYLTSWENFDL